MNDVHRSSKPAPMCPKEDPCKFGRYGAGTPKHLGDSLRLTWAQHPSSERIVEDIFRLPTTIDATIAHKGCHVGEEAFHKKGCSRKQETEGSVGSWAQFRSFGNRPPALWKLALAG